MKKLLRQILTPRQLQVLKEIKFHYGCFHLKLLHRLCRLLKVCTISEINLEFVNYCNLKCKWCSLDRAQKKHAMKEDLLCKFFDNLLSDKRLRSIKTLNLWSGGETLLHPELLSLLNLFKRYKAAFSIRNVPFPRVSLLTNGIPLPPDLCQELVNLDILDLIRFSVDGGSKEKYEELRAGAKWDSVYKNISDFVKINNGKIKTGIICICENDKKLTTEWMTDEFKNLLNLVDHVQLRYPHDWIGDVRVEGCKMPYVDYCTFLIHTLVVLPNGDVTVCCADLNGKWPIGNLYNEDLYRIYDSPKRQGIISNLFAGRREKIGLCKNCRGYV